MIQGIQMSCWWHEATQEAGSSWKEAKIGFTATTKSNYSLLHKERDVMKRRQNGDGDYCSSSIGCRNKVPDKSAGGECKLPHTYLCTHSPHGSIWTPQSWNSWAIQLSSLHWSGQPVHSFNCKHSSAFLEGHSGAIIISLSKLFHYLIKLWVQYFHYLL